MVAIDNDWEFMLRGNVHHLRSLGEMNTGLDIRFFTEPDYANDTISNDFRFKTWFCNKIEDGYEAWQIGLELIFLFNGANTICSENHEIIKIYQLTKGNEIFPQPEFDDDIRLKDSDVFAKDVHKTSHSEDVKNLRQLHLVHLSKSQDDVYFLLKMSSLEMNWVTLYKILETVEHYIKVGGLSLAIDKAMRNAFTASANNFSVTGIQSRHGPNTQLPPNKTMNLPEAKAFIREVVQQYIELKHPL